MLIHVLPIGNWADHWFIFILEMVQKPVLWSAATGHHDGEAVVCWQMSNLTAFTGIFRAEAFFIDAGSKFRWDLANPVLARVLLVVSTLRKNEGGAVFQSWDTLASPTKWIQQAVRMWGMQRRIWEVLQRSSTEIIYCFHVAFSPAENFK